VILNKSGRKVLKDTVWVRAVLVRDLYITILAKKRLCKRPMEGTKQRKTGRLQTKMTSVQDGPLVRAHGAIIKNVLLKGEK